MGLSSQENDFTIQIVLQSKKKKNLCLKELTAQSCLISKKASSPSEGPIGFYFYQQKVLCQSELSVFGLVFSGLSNKGWHFCRK